MMPAGHGGVKHRGNPRGPPGALPGVQPAGCVGPAWLLQAGAARPGRDHQGWVPQRRTPSEFSVITPSPACGPPVTGVAVSVKLAPETLAVSS